MKWSQIYSLAIWSKRTQRCENQTITIILTCCLYWLPINFQAGFQLISKFRPKLSKFWNQTQITIVSSHFLQSCWTFYSINLWKSANLVRFATIHYFWSYWYLNGYSPFTCNGIPWIVRWPLNGSTHKNQIIIKVMRDSRPLFPSNWTIQWIIPGHIQPLIRFKYEKRKFVYFSLKLRLCFIH